LENEEVMERVVIRSSNWLGDAVMSVPAVRALKRSNPGAHIAMLTPEKIADVWRLVAEVDEVIAFPAARRGIFGKVSGALHVFRVARLIRGCKFDTAVIFPNSLRTALEMWLARIPRRVAYAGHSRRALLTEIFHEEKNEPATAPGPHQVFHYLHLAEFLGARVEPDASFGFPNAADKNRRAPGKPARIAVCAGAEYGPAKRWLPERYGEVIVAVSETTECRWQLVGTTKDRAVAAEIAALAGNPANVENLCGGTTLAELIAVLRESDVLLTNDTGTMHLAALLGVRTVAIFGSTEPALTAPLGAGHVIVRKHVECSPCFLRECPIDFRCMREVKSQAVIAALRDVLGVSASV
jgi:lipopolysaccharide heptosyltransferase II